MLNKNSSKNFNKVSGKASYTKWFVKVAEIKMEFEIDTSI